MRELSDLDARELGSVSDVPGAAGVWGQTIRRGHPTKTAG